MSQMLLLFIIIRMYDGVLLWHEPDFSNIRRDAGDRPIGSGCGEGVGSNS